MKPKFLLNIVALNTLFIGISIAIAPNVKAEDNLPKLSQTISKLINLDSKYHSLVTSAIDRAIASKKAIDSTQKKEVKPPTIVHVTAGIIAPEIREKPQVDRPPTEQNNKNIQPSNQTTTNNKNIVDGK